MGHAPSHFYACFSSRMASEKSVHTTTNPPTLVTYGNYLSESPSKLVLSPISESKQISSPTPISSPSSAPEHDESSWAWLPTELLVTIAEKLWIGDYIQLRAVCSSWASALASVTPRSRFPWLMIHHGPYSFLSLFDNWTYHFPSETKCTELLGSQDGWLVSRGAESQISLSNPITGLQISLSPFSPNLYINKVVLSSTDRGDFIIVVLYGVIYYHLAFMKVGETNTSWSPLYPSPYMETDRGIENVVYHDGMFFIITCKGQVEAFDLNGPSPKRVSFPNSCIRTVAKSSPYTGYLVSSSGDLLHVWKVKHTSTRRCTYFTIMKFNPKTKFCWEKIEDLGTRCLFLDTKQSMSLDANEVEGMKGNCIYFTNERRNDGCKYVSEVGVFDIKEGTIQPCIPQKFELYCSPELPLIWFKPILP